MQRLVHAPWIAFALRFTLGCAVGGILSHAAAAEQARFVLDLPDGGMLPGSFAPVAAAEEGPRETLQWKSAPFIDPFEFRLDGIIGIRATRTVTPPGEVTGFRCRLRGGDIIDGKLEAIDADGIVLTPDGNHAPVRIARADVSSVRRRSGGDGTGYVGPGGLVGWRQEPADSWRDEAARLTSNRRHAEISRDIPAPPRARYDIVLSWRETPELVIAVAALNGNDPDPYRFEWLQDKAGVRAGFIARQEQSSGSLEEVPVPAVDAGRLRMSLFVDASTGRLAIAMEGVDRIVETTVAAAHRENPSGQFRVTLLSGDVCLESLRVTAWTSPDPRAEERSETAVVTSTGRVVAGGIESLDAAANTVVVAAAEGATTIPFTEVDAIEFEGEETALPAANAAERAPSIRVVRQGGGVVTGNLLAASDTTVEVVRPGITGAVVIPLGDLLAITALQSTPSRPLTGRAGMLLVGDAKVPGCIVDAAAWGGGIAWLPTGSLSASGFAPGSEHGLSAEVEYAPRVDRPDENRTGQVEIGGVGASINVLNEAFVVSMVVEDGAAARDGQIEPGDRILAVRPKKDGPFVETKGIDLETVMNLLRGRVGTPVGVRVESADGKRRTVDLVRGLIYIADREILDRALAAHSRVAVAAAAADEPAGYPAIVALRSGDLVPAAVERIDSKGVWLRSPVTSGAGREEIVVADHLVKAIELDPAASTQGIPRDRFERLLTVPRSQQSDPPTHLVRLRTGDYLRGKLVALDGAHVVFEVLGQRKKLPRQSVVRLIWLHPENLLTDGRKEAAAIVPATVDGGLIVQGLASGGERTTLEVERVEGPAIIGKSPAFGPARIDTTRIDRLLVGAAIKSDGDDLPFSKWRLRLAPLPRALRDKE